MINAWRKYLRPTPNIYRRIGYYGGGLASYGFSRSGSKAAKGRRLRASKRPRRPTPRNRGNATITRQHDLRTTYKKSRPSSKARRFRKFAKKVKKATAANSKLHFAQVASLGTLTFLTTNINDDNKQVIYPSNASIADLDMRLYQGGPTSVFASLENALRTVPIGVANPGALNVTTRPMFGQDLHFWCQEKMEIGIKNISTEAFVLDIYICEAKDDIEDGSFQTAVGAWTSACTQSQSLNGVPPFTAQLSPTFSGVEPIDGPSFGKYWSVQSKQRLEIQPSEVICTTLQGKGKWIKYAQWDGKEVKKGYTLDIILVACPIWNPFPIGVVTPIAELQWQKTCKLRYPGLFQGTQMAFTGAWAV